MPSWCGRGRLYILYKSLEDLRPFIRTSPVNPPTHPFSHLPVRPYSHPPNQSSNHRPCCVHGTQCKKKKTQERTGLLLAYVLTQEILLDLGGASRSVKCSRKCHQIHSSSLNFMNPALFVFRKCCVCCSLAITSNSCVSVTLTLQ